MITRAAVFSLTTLAHACELAAALLFLVRDIISLEPVMKQTESPWERWASDEGCAALKALEIGEIVGLDKRNE